MQRRRYSCNYPSLYASELSILFSALPGRYQLCGFPVKLFCEFELMQADAQRAELWFADAVTSLILIKRQAGCCQRSYLCCPKCFQLKTKLYWADSQLACLSCSGLSYGSQSEGQLDLMMRRVRRLRRAIWCTSDVEVDNLLLNCRFFMRPDRMHFKTYTRLMTNLLEAEKKLWIMQGEMLGITLNKECE